MAKTDPETEDAAENLLKEQVKADFKIWHSSQNHAQNHKLHSLRKSHPEYKNFDWSRVWKRYHELLKEDVKRIGSNRKILEGHEELERREI